MFQAGTRVGNRSGHIAGQQGRDAAGAGASTTRWARSEPAGYLLSTVAVLVIAVLYYPFRELLGVTNVSLLYVLLLFGVGLGYGAGPAIASALLAFVFTDFLFYPPYFTFLIAKTPHLLGLLFFLAIAVAAGWVGARLRAYTEKARREARRSSMLYDLNRALTSDVTLDQVLTSIARGVVEIYGARAARVLVPEAMEPIRFDARAAWPATRKPLDRQEARVAERVFETGVVSGRGTAGRRVVIPHGPDAPSRTVAPSPGDDLLFVPIETSGGRMGILEVAGRPGGGRFGREDERMLKSFADQAALAVQRTRLVEEATRSRALEESNELKSALLAAVSHDLRTPLAAIKMSASTLHDRTVQLSDGSRQELLEGIEESTDWLALLVDNLLDLSRIEGGALRPDRDWHDLTDLMHHVVNQMHRQLAHHRLALHIPDDLPLVSIDYVQISQVLANLLGNAVKYSDLGSDIEVGVDLDDTTDAVRLVVRDHGRGIGPGDLAHVFEAFYRAPANSSIVGTGVGLAICKGLVEAHGGTITASSRAGAGTTMTVRLPLDPGGDGALERET